MGDFMNITVNGMPLVEVLRLAAHLEVQEHFE